jgi:glycosyltransferase involved in cell wall biosynthesis
MRTLIGIPAYNEEMTIGQVIAGVHSALPACDIVVVDDGSRDKTADIVRESAATLLQLPCNLGYSNAIETLLYYAAKRDYDCLVLIDADGQHDPTCLPGFLAAFESSDCDMMIGSRYINDPDYKDAPFGRRLGMVMFSLLTKSLAGKRIYDTTSGMKGIKRQAIQSLLAWHFLDFHAEAITYLLWSKFTIEEYPITVSQREYGQSMYSLISHLWYPLSVVLLIVITRIHFLQNYYSKNARRLRRV